MGLKERLKYWLDVILGDEAQRRALGARRKALPARKHVNTILFPDRPEKPARTKAEIDAYLERLSSAISQDNPPNIPSIIVTGAMRCGKTRVAKAVGQETGLVHVPSDRLRAAIYEHTEDAERRRLVKYTYKRLMLAHPTGVVFEGTVFLDTDNTLLDWAKARGRQIFVIGYARNRVARKARSMIKFRQHHDCWTKDSVADADMTQLARKIILHSQNLRARCKAEGMTYIDLDSAQFQSELACVTQQIMRSLRRPKRGHRRPGTQPRGLTKADGQRAE
ncbi:MAG: hypothetical protein ACK4HW_11045 [Roseinatronobacter sp.]